MRDKITKTIHEAIVEMGNLGLTHQEIADTLGLNRTTVTHDLLGKRKTPYHGDSVVTLEVLSRALQKASEAIKASNEALALAVKIAAEKAEKSAA